MKEGEILLIIEKLIPIFDIILTSAFI